MPSQKTKIVWREWYNATTLAALTKMGTLPRYEAMVDTSFQNGAGVARLVAAAANRADAELFARGGEIVILEPEEFAGTYSITVDYDPVFYAHPV